MADTKASKGLTATGVRTIDCTQHDMKLPNGVSDLQMGEKCMPFSTNCSFTYYDTDTLIWIISCFQHLQSYLISPMSIFYMTLPVNGTRSSRTTFLDCPSSSNLASRQTHSHRYPVHLHRRSSTSSSLNSISQLTSRPVRLNFPSTRLQVLVEPTGKCLNADGPISTMWLQVPRKWALVPAKIFWMTSLEIQIGKKTTVLGS
jgi:hypothetical protein